MNSPDHSTKGTPSRRCPWRTTRSNSLRLLVGTGVQALFHPPRGVLFTFPSRYSSTIGGWACLALEGGPPSFPQDFSCPAVLRYGDPHHAPVAYGTLTRCGGASQRLRLTVRLGEDSSPPYNPAWSQKDHAVWAAPGSLATTTGISR